MPHATRSLHRVLLPAIPAALALPAAQAQVIYTSLAEPAVVTPNSILYWDLGSGGTQGTVSTLSANQPFSLFFGWDSSQVPRMNDTSFSQVLIVGTYVSILAVNTRIGADSVDWSSGSNDTYFNYYNDANWAPGTTGYIGLRVDVAENTFIYGKNLGDHLRAKIRLMEKYRHKKPRIDPDILWRAPAGQPWPEGF